jgi:hypothetical protein
VEIWYVFPYFGTLNKEKSGNPVAHDSMKNERRSRCFLQDRSPAMKNSSDFFSYRIFFPGKRTTQIRQSLKKKEFCFQRHFFGKKIKAYLQFDGLNVIDALIWPHDPTCLYQTKLVEKESWNNDCT